MCYYSLVSLQPAPISEVAYVGQVSYLRAAFQAALPKFPDRLNLWLRLRCHVGQISNLRAD
jgi:hypothetical protein